MFDFDTIIDRRGTGACKWDRRTAAEAAAGVVPMSIADMEFLAAPCVREAVARAAAHGVYGYTDPSPRLMEALTGWLARRHGLNVEPADIRPIVGVVPALNIAVRAFSQPGEGVILQAPVYPPFRSAILGNGRRVENAPLQRVGDRYEMDFDALEAAAAKPDVRLLLFCSPHNPTGRVWTPEELARVAAICEKHGVTVFSDEIHADLVLRGKHTSFLCANEWARAHAVVACAPSKTFNVPGLQLAFFIAPNHDLLETFRAQAQASGLENCSYFGHAAAIAAYEGGWDWLEAALAYVRENERCLHDFLRERLPMLHALPIEGTYLAWVDCSGLHMAKEALYRFIREDAMLIIDDGDMFGEEGAPYIRINIALPRAALLAALTRLETAVRNRAVNC